MKFSELDIGVRFRFTDCSETVYVKVSLLQACLNGELIDCNGAMECTMITEPDIKEFGELVIGARFRFVKGTRHRVKVSIDSYHYADSSSIMLIGSKDEECVPVFEPKELTFRDLEIGETFHFETSTLIRHSGITLVKKSNGTYIDSTLYQVIEPNAEVKR